MTANQETPPLAAHPVIVGAAGRPGSIPTGAFVAAVTYAVIEYARPHSFFGLGYLRPTLLVSTLLIYYLAVYNWRVRWYERQNGLWGLVVLMMAVWVPFARNNYFSFGAFQIIAQTYLFALAFTTFVDSGDRLRRFMVVWAFAIAFQALWGITHGGRGNGNFLTDENDFSLFMNMGIPFAVFGARVSKERMGRWACYAVAALCVIAVIASGSRGGFVGLAATGIALVAVGRHKIRALIAAVAVVGLMTVLAPAKYWEEMETILDPQDRTRVGRQDHWRLAIKMWKASPVFGVGQGNFAWNAASYEDTHLTGRSASGRAAHSLYFTLLPELGLVGVTIYALILGFTISDLRRLRRARPPPDCFGFDAYANAILVALVAYLVSGAFLSVLYYPHLQYLTAMTLVMRRLSMESASGLDKEQAASRLDPAPSGQGKGH